MKTFKFSLVMLCVSVFMCSCAGTFVKPDTSSRGLAERLGNKP